MKPSVTFEVLPWARGTFCVHNNQRVGIDPHDTWLTRKEADKRASQYNEALEGETK